ncbi:MFS transporter [Pectobacterium parmentieri]|uniref:MFS transporter n=1 Tax=Pectobacterium parmentieri TaxID=1905730 RepID=UPI000CDD8963|nr:MFS transporter [Pectobacterium parmentieri]AYH06228.1 MFS transporter [Pectobacterium parmentieri]AYH15047.1 MFS transporter [Pectobacterium parmentieri]AYH23747.1 MFS transporter [Pectobacterium parmentieri]MBN3177035.1 MFS transporter [Pectobacterium parmentieri]POW30740.1 MFS transporter [Pectobacterium parmentieri]
MNTSSSIPISAVAQHPWLAVAAVGLATFSVVTAEMLPVGLLTPIADTLNTSTGTAGLMISLPALLAALFAPLVVIASGGMDRRMILCGLLTLLIIANIASALAPDIGWMLGARVLVGFCMGGIWAIAGGLAARLVPEPSIGLATSIIFGGVAAASVLGVPFGALIGDIVGWRWAFGCMAVFSGLVLILLLAVIPALPVAHSTTVHQFGEQLTNSKLQVGLILTLLLVAGHFTAFTFVRPLLLSVSGFDTQWISALLFSYGLAGIVGNFLAGIIAAQRTVLTLTIIAFGLLLTSILFLTLGDSPVGGGVALLVWGLAYGGVSVGLMTWMMKVAPRAVEVASALYVGVFNIGIAFGSWVGGQIVDSSGLITTLWLAGGFTATALLLLVSIRLVEQWKVVE